MLAHGVTIRGLHIERSQTEDSDWITFDAGGLPAPSTIADSIENEDECQLPLLDVVRFFAGLDYRMETRRANHSHLATIPAVNQAMIRRMLSDGRLLSAAYIDEPGNNIVLRFGARDAAVSSYW